MYELLLIKLSMNANIKKTQIFHKMMYDLKGHVGPLYVQKVTFSEIYFLFKFESFQNFVLTLRIHNFS